MSEEHDTDDDDAADDDDATTVSTKVKFPVGGRAIRQCLTSASR